MGTELNYEVYSKVALVDDLVTRANNAESNGLDLNDFMATDTKLGFIRETGIEITHIGYDKNCPEMTEADNLYVNGETVISAVSIDGDITKRYATTPNENRMRAFIENIDEFTATFLARIGASINA